MYLLIRIFYAIFSRMPLSVLQFIGRNTGTIMYYLLSSRRQVAIKNCEIIGVDNPKAVAKSSFRHTFSSYIESFYTKNIDQKFIDEMVEIEYIGEKPDTRGCFFVSAHLGAWELLSYVMTGKAGLKGAAVARKIKDKKVDEFIKKQRKNSEVSYIHHRGATDSIKEYIDKNLTVGVLLDHSSMPKDSMAVPFFGLNTTFIKGMPLLAIRKNYPVLPGFIIRKEKGFKLIIYPMMYPNQELKPKERAHDLALRINKIYEEVIREYPDQWYLIHKRFKRLADDEGNFISGIYS